MARTLGARRVRLAGLALVLMVTAGVAASRRAQVAELDPLAIDQLRALGYLDFAETAHALPSGVVHHDAELSQPGFTLHTLRPLCRAELLDTSGQVVRSWSHPCRNWERAELLDDGDVLVVARARSGPSLDEVQAARHVMRFSWDGELRWKRFHPAHHDIEAMPDGRLLMLTHRFRQIPEIHPDLAIDDNGIALLSPDGELLEEVSLYDILRAGPDPFPLRLPEVNVARVDLLHANSVETIAASERAGTHPVYQPGYVLVCIRNQDAIAVVDRTRAELVWSWGPGELSGPHDATMLDNGHILVFDNGVKRGRSRVVELDPISKRIVWQYSAPDFFTATRGSSQRLPNGNTLISQSDFGRGFEVTPGGRRVWEFFTPHRNEHGQLSTIVRMRRLAPETIGAPRG